MSVTAIILARAGSKRIPHKNTRSFRGKPLLAWPTRAALAWGQFDRVLISTDSEDIAALAASLGAEHTGLRKDTTASDTATTSEALLECAHRLQKEDRLPDYLCCIYGSAAFIDSTMLWTAFDKLKNENFDTVFPVVRFAYPIWRSLRRSSEGETTFIWPEHTQSRSQDLPVAYHDAGQFYIVRSAMLLKTGSIIGGRTGSIELAESECHDIDTFSDWEIAEMKHSLRFQFETDS
jgi:pseudaminic acid cytidylyltransferase